MGKVLAYKVVGKEFYCRYCSDYEQCRGTGHRSGIWFKVAFGNPETGRCIYVILGEGESEKGFPFNCDVGKHIRTGMSGCRTYERGHITMSDWYSLTDIVVERTEDDFNKLKEVELSASEQILLARLLNESRVKVIRELIEAGVTWVNEDWGLWNDLKPLFYTYLRDGWKEFPLGAFIHESYRSFTAEFEWDTIIFCVPKARYDVVDYRDYMAIFFGCRYDARRAVFYGKPFGRKVVYYYSNYRLYANEIYNGHEHPMALLSLQHQRKQLT
ncbi:MAG: hypothetical protein DRN91_08475 [Candidatus Alkanophagales archaeon]|nr:MAG: hypothetical protein DRN91_08475 [Candidatus Alkanophagales archaeon]